MLIGDSTGRDSGLVIEEGTDADQQEVEGRSVDLRREEDDANTAGWDVVGVATAAVSNCRVDRAGRAAGEVRTSVRHGADHHLKVFFDVPYGPCRVVAAGSQASVEMLVLGKCAGH